MGRDNRTWSSVAAKLAISEPLGNATSVPADVFPLVASHPTYRDLFQAAFGDPAITGERIALAIATYERTLVADQTPWDRFVAGNPAALTPGQTAGWNFFRQLALCAACHTPPQFTNATYRNIGVRPPPEDTGRQEVTGLAGDRGRFKVPTLRGVGLKTTYMHNGVFSNLQDVIAHYRPNNPAIFLDNIDPILPVPVPPQGGPALVDFLVNGLTDPRVAAQSFPFDQPALHAGGLPLLSFDADKTTLHWPSLQGVPSYVMYRGDLADLVDGNADGLPDAGYGVCVTGDDPNPTDTVFVDSDTPAAGQGFFYLKGWTARPCAGVTSAVKPRSASTFSGSPSGSLAGRPAFKSARRRRARKEQRRLPRTLRAERVRHSAGGLRCSRRALPGPRANPDEPPADREPRKGRRSCSGRREAQ
jgi:hypothetical protein